MFQLENEQKYTVFGILTVIFELNMVGGESKVVPRKFKTEKRISTLARMRTKGPYKGLDTSPS